ncbi:MAG TPA: hypothetical protein VFF40_09975 [Acidimicrobiia bacterium]|nr:hypothetical protein [Acidimicrobiia bacterium]
MPLVVLAVVSIVQSSEYHLTSDQAILGIHTNDVGRRAVLFGPYSRLGWHHPGPALFYVLALPYRLFGADGTALQLGALIVNGAALVGVAVVARRRAGVRFALLTLLCAVILMHALGPALLRDVWNPSITVVPYLLVVLLAWAIADGDRWAIPWAVGVASFVVQTHIGYALVTVTPVVIGAFALVWRTARVDGTLRALRSLAPVGLVTLVTALVLWSAPLVEQLSGDPGNLGLVLQYTRAGNDARASFGVAGHAVARVLGAGVPWLTGDTARSPYTGELVLVGRVPVPLGALALLGGGVLAWRRGDRTSLRLVAIVGATLVASVLSVAGIRGVLYVYLVHWLWVLGALCWLAAIWAVARALPQPPRTVLRRLALPAS